MKSKTKRLVYCAMLCAIYCILSVVSIRTKTVKISVDMISIMFAGFMFGSKYGMYTGFVASFLSQMVFYGLDISNVWWAIPCAISGFLFGVLKEKRYLAIIVNSPITTIINTLVLFIDSKYYGYYTPYLIYGTFLYRIIVGILFSFVYCLIWKLLEKYFIKEKCNGYQL